MKQKIDWETVVLDLIGSIILVVLFGYSFVLIGR